MASQPSYRPLRSIRILDLSRVLAGPWASQILADLGAEVIKVEKPDCGDETRRWAPPSLSNDQAPYQESAYFLSANRGKKSVAIDFSRPEGQKLIKELAKSCDILLENCKTNSLSKYGLAYEQLKEVNPALIYCSITGFGQTGPWSHLPGFDYIIQAMGGLMSVTGLPDGEAGAGPLRVGVPIADLMTGMYTAVAVLAALVSRQSSSDQQGVAIDMALYDVQLAMLANQGMNYLVSGQAPSRSGHQHPNIVPYQVFPTADEPVVIAVGNDQQFCQLCQALGLTELAEDERFASNSQRVAHRTTLLPMLTAQVKQHKRQDLLALLQARGVPCSPVNDIAAALHTPQSQARQMLEELDHPMFGKIKAIANPIHYRQKTLPTPSAPPVLGQDTRQVLREMLNLSDSELDELARKQVISASTAST